MRARVFKITDTSDNVYYFRRRVDAIDILNKMCDRKITLNLFDNFLYHPNESRIPQEIKKIDNIDMYDFMKEDFNKTHGDKYIKSCWKTWQMKHYKLFDELFNYTKKQEVTK